MSAELAAQLLAQAQQIATDVAHGYNLAPAQVLDDPSQRCLWRWRDAPTATGGGTLSVSTTRMRFRSEFERNFELSIMLADTYAALPGVSEDFCHDHDPPGVPTDAADGTAADDQVLDEQGASAPASAEQQARDTATSRSRRQGPA